MAKIVLLKDYSLEVNYPLLHCAPFFIKPTSERNMITSSYKSRSQSNSGILELFYYNNIGRNIQHNAEKFTENATIINKLIKDEIRLFSVNLGHPDVGM